MDKNESSINVFWFRRDLRLEDNAGLYHALNSSLPVLPVFIFDKNILDEIEDRNDRRVSFILHRISILREQLAKNGGDLRVYYGRPDDVFKKLVKENNIHTVYTN